MAATYLLDLVTQRHPIPTGPSAGQPGRPAVYPNIKLGRDTPDEEGYSAGMVYLDGNTYGLTLDRGGPNERTTESDGALIWNAGVPVNPNDPEESWTYRSDYGLVHTISNVAPFAYEQFDVTGALVTFTPDVIYLGDPSSPTTFKDNRLDKATVEAIEAVVGQNLPGQWTAERLIRRMFGDPSGKRRVVSYRETWDDMSGEWELYSATGASGR